MRYLTLLIKSNLVETPMVMKTTFCVLLMFVSGAAGLCAEAEVAELAAPGSRMFLRQGWKIQSSAKVPEKGSVISTVLFQPKGWYPTDIPSTVLAALVRNHVYPNPDFGMNLRSIPGTTYPIGANFSNIPMPSDSPFRPGWWYRTEFRLPPSARGKTLWLHFDGINYRANIWLNGREIACAGNLNLTSRHGRVPVKSTLWLLRFSHQLPTTFRSRLWIGTRCRRIRIWASFAMFTSPPAARSPCDIRRLSLISTCRRSLSRAWRYQQNFVM